MYLLSITHEHITHLKNLIKNLATVMHFLAPKIHFEIYIWYMKVEYKYIFSILFNFIVYNIYLKYILGRIVFFFFFFFWPELFFSSFFYLFYFGQNLFLLFFYLFYFGQNFLLLFFFFLARIIFFFFFFYYFEMLQYLYWKASQKH